MKKYALILLLVVGLSTNAWGYIFTSLPNTCFIGNTYHVAALNMCPTVNLCPTLSPCIGMMSHNLMLVPHIWGCSPVYQAASCTDLSYQGVSVYQGTFGNFGSTACQNSVNLQIHSNCVQVSGNTQP